MITPESLRGLYRAPGVDSPPPSDAPLSLAIVTCMDHRLRPEQALGVPAGSACVIRNAGGRVTADALRSLVVASTTLGVDEIVVMQHTECAVAGTTNERIAQAIRQHLDVDIGTADFLPIDDLRSSIQADVHRVRDSPFVPGEIPVTGVLCTTATGQVTVVDADALSQVAPRLGPDPSAAGTGGS